MGVVKEDMLRRKMLESEIEADDPPRWPLKGSSNFVFARQPHGSVAAKKQQDCHACVSKTQTS